MLQLAAAGLLCSALASAEDAARREEGGALDLQDEVARVQKESSAGVSLRDLIRVRMMLDSRFIPHSDFDGFDTSFYRPGARLKVTVPVSKSAALRLVTNFNSAIYDFDDVDTDPFAVGAGSGDPFDELHSASWRLQAGYRFDDFTLFSEREAWSLLAEGVVRSSWEDGSPFEKGLRQGGGFAVGYQFGDFLELALGVGVGTKLVKNGVSVSPRFEVDWKITDSWRLTTYRQGLQILYAVNERLAVFARSRLESRRYRVERRSGAVGRGSLRDRQIPVGLGVRWQLSRYVRVTGVAGVIADHELRFRNGDGDSVGNTVTSDPAPFFELRFDLRP